MNKKTIIAKVMEKLSQIDSKKIYENLIKIPIGKKRNEYLQNYVHEKGLNKEQVSELMYDLKHKHDLLNIQKPEPHDSKEFQKLKQKLKNITTPSELLEMFNKSDPKVEKTKSEIIEEYAKKNNIPTIKLKTIKLDELSNFMFNEIKKNK